MDSDKINRWLTLGANLGVVVGILFLAIELRQNNENLAAQQRGVNYLGGVATWEMVASNPSLAQLISKDFSGEDLTSAESVQLLAFWTRVHTSIQWAYFEVPEDEFQRTLPFQRRDYLDSPTNQLAWRNRRDYFDPQFVAYMEENVFVTKKPMTANGR